MTVISGLRNSESSIRRIIGSDREMFDQIDPETLQIVKYANDRNSIYSKDSGRKHQQEQEELNWDMNSELEMDLQKKESFKKRMTDIRNQNIETQEVVEGKQEHGFLDEFLVSDDVSKTRRVKSISAPTSSASNVNELYNKVLPELRNELRKNGLRQIGFVKFNNASDDTLIKKLTSSSKEEHDAFNPMAFEDPSLRILAPKQWKGALPTLAKDDIIQSAINGLQTEFNMSSNFLRQGDAIEYDFNIFQENQLQSNALSSISIQLVITLTHVGTSRTLLQTKKSFQFQDGSLQISRMNQKINVNTNSLEPGSYQIFAQVLLFLPNSSTSSILSSHGPFDLYLLAK